MMNEDQFRCPWAAVALAAAILAPATALAAETGGDFLANTRHHTTVGSMVPANGDQNPYGIVVAPVSAGKVQKGDLLVTNFNNAKNLQGLGTTIIDYNPTTKKVSVFAQLDPKLAQCPGGVGLTTALTMLTSGWVIVGSLPSSDGTTATKGTGCLIVLNSQGKVADTITGPNINGPWGNIAVVDRGNTATLFVSNTGFGVGAPTDNSPVVKHATVLRLSLTIPAGKSPAVTGQTVVGDGFGEQADKGVFILGPTGLALSKTGDLYVSDALGNRIAAIPDALTRATSAGTGTTITSGGMLQRPLALAITPDGHLLTTNGLNGQVVEIDPAAGKQLSTQWIDADKAQQPPGNGDLFGIAMAPDGQGFYCVEDDLNTLVLAH
jgi:hypothetical protein